MATETDEKSRLIDEAQVNIQDAIDVVLTRCRQFFQRVA